VVNQMNQNMVEGSYGMCCLYSVKLIMELVSTRHFSSGYRSERKVDLPLLNSISQALLVYDQTRSDDGS
jgi:hypothetical protein